MSDAPTIKQSIGEAMTDTASDTQSTEVIAEESPQVEPDQKAEKKQPEVPEIEREETFAEKGDLQGKTPEELEEIYKNWQRAYTEKRQKETQELKHLREQVEQSKARSKTAERSVQDIRQDAQQAQRDVELGKMSVEQYTEHIKKLMAEEARQIAREEFRTLSTAQKEQQYQEQAYQAFISADDKGRLNPDSPTADEVLINEVQGFLAKELQKHIEEKGTAKGFDAGTLAKKRVEEYDARLDEIIKKRTQQSTQLAQARAAKAKKSATKGTNTDSSPVDGNSIKDILSKAVEETGS